MRQRQIVKTRKEGSTVYYRVASPKISQACDMVREVLLDQLNQKQEIAKTYLTIGGNKKCVRLVLDAVADADPVTTKRKSPAR